MPIVDSNDLHFLNYYEAKLLKKVDQRDRPSIKIRQETKQTKNFNNVPPSSASVGKESMCLASSTPMTAQNARAVVYYVQCEKPLVIYSMKKLNHNQRMLLAESISSFE